MSSKLCHVHDPCAQEIHIPLVFFLIIIPSPTPTDLLNREKSLLMCCSLCRFAPRSATHVTPSLCTREQLTSLASRKSSRLVLVTHSHSEHTPRPNTYRHNKPLLPVRHWRSGWRPLLSLTAQQLSSSAASRRSADCTGSRRAVRQSEPAVGCRPRPSHSGIHRTLFMRLGPPAQIDSIKTTHTSYSH